MKRPEIVPYIEAKANTGDSAVAGTYHTDILTWSEQQAGLLRRVGAGEPINDQVDWDHVVEEIEALGQYQVDQVRSWLMQAMLHMLKVKAFPNSLAVDHWKAEMRGFLDDAVDTYRPSMRLRIAGQGCRHRASYSAAQRALQGPCKAYPPWYGRRRTAERHEPAAYGVLRRSPPALPASQLRQAT